MEINIFMLYYSKEKVLLTTTSFHTVDKILCYAMGYIIMQEKLVLGIEEC